MKKTIVLCSSAVFFEELFDYKEKLENLGFDVEMPISAERMKEAGDFDVSKIKTWFDNVDDMHKKTWLMKHHLEKVKNGDIVLDINLPQKGFEGYIGGNVFLELFYGWMNDKPLYILNPISKEQEIYEEVMGMNPVFLNGDLTKIEK